MDRNSGPNFTVCRKIVVQRVNDPSLTQYALASLGHSHDSLLQKFQYESPFIITRDMSVRKVDFRTWVKTQVLFFSVCRPKFMYRTIGVNIVCNAVFLSRSSREIVRNFDVFGPLFFWRGGGAECMAPKFITYSFVNMRRNLVSIGQATSEINRQNIKKQIGLNLP